MVVRSDHLSAMSELRTISISRSEALISPRFSVSSYGWFEDFDAFDAAGHCSSIVDHLLLCAAQRFQSLGTRYVIERHAKSLASLLPTSV